MLPLTLDDLMPLDEYTVKRREFFESHCRYLDRYRRVRIGPVATLVFENRQTLWFRVHEFLRIARLADSVLVQRELDLFNHLLPGPSQLQGALLIESKEDANLSDQAAAWTGLTGEHIRFLLGDDTIGSILMTARPEDRAFGTAHWVLFTFDDTARDRLADPRLPAFVETTLPAYQHRSATLSEEVRGSLCDDLKNHQE
jgi:hypothetical protein